MKTSLCALRGTPLITLIITAVHAIAQPAIPEWGPAFPQDEVAVIRITIDPDTLDSLLSPNNWGNGHDFPATFSYESLALNQTVDQIGLRLRGNTSLGAQKKSFKIVFDAFEPNANWLGFEKLNLIAQHNDPSLLRAKLCWDSMRHFGLPGARTSFVKLYINDEYKGVYQNTEHIDENFTRTYFGDGTGQLWKCLYPADLNYLGSGPELYKQNFFDRRIYDLKTNEFQDDYRPLAEMIDVLNNTSLSSLPCALERVFNVHDYLKYLALDVLTSNWDGYAFNNNNFYLCVNEITGVIEYVPYDLDNTLGMDWFGVDWASRPVYDWSPQGQSRPLYDRLMQVPQYRNQFSYYLHHFINEWFNQDGIVAHAHNLHTLIEAAALEDPYRSLDYGFTEEDFLLSIDEAWGEQVAYSIAGFVAARS
jgi:hypothetical protein